MLTIISIFLKPSQIYQKKLYLGVVRYLDKVKLVSTGRIASVCSGREGEGASPPYPRKYIFPVKGNIFDLPKEIYFSLLTCVYFYLQRGIYLLSRLENQIQGLFQIQFMRINVANKAVYYCRAVVGGSS